MTCEDARFAEHPEIGTCVEAVVRLGAITGTYTVYLTLEQAVKAGIIGRTETD